LCTEGQRQDRLLSAHCALRVTKENRNSEIQLDVIVPDCEKNDAVGD
jgi:hypothetical protein